MTTSIIFKVDSKTKDQLTKKAKKLNMTLSEYMRLLIEDKKNLQKKENPFLKLEGMMTNEEVDLMFGQIKKDRRNKK
jgi:antitoxin component of RelBE/YafQ-DinJ toxin-antitoxin module